MRWRLGMYFRRSFNGTKAPSFPYWTSCWGERGAEKNASGRLPLASRRFIFSGASWPATWIQLMCTLVSFSSFLKRDMLLYGGARDAADANIVSVTLCLVSGDFNGFSPNNHVELLAPAALSEVETTSAQLRTNAIHVRRFIFL